MTPCIDRPLSEPKHHQGWKYLSMYMYTCKHTRSFMIIFMGIRILFNKFHVFYNWIIVNILTTLKFPSVLHVYLELAYKDIIYICPFLTTLHLYGYKINFCRKTLPVTIIVPRLRRHKILLVNKFTVKKKMWDKDQVLWPVLPIASSLQSYENCEIHKLLWDENLY